MNPTNNMTTTDRLITTTILLAAASISTYITCQFFYEKSIQMGYAPLLFVMLGVTFDVTKLYLPRLAARKASTTPLLSLMYAAITLCLVAFSLVATISAVETFADGEKTASREYQALTHQITTLLEEKAKFAALAERQLKINQSTKAEQNALKISEINAQIAALMDKQANLPSATTFGQHSDKVAIAIALLLEAICLGMSLALASDKKQLRPATHTDDSVTPSVTAPVFTHSAPVTAITHTAHTAPPQVTFAAKEVTATTTDSQIFADVKQAILSGAVKPSHRAIRAQFRIGQDKIKAVLAELNSAGYLVEYNNGYRLQLA